MRCLHLVSPQEGDDDWREEEVTVAALDTNNLLQLLGVPRVQEGAGEDAAAGDVDYGEADFGADFAGDDTSSTVGTDEYQSESIGEEVCVRPPQRLFLLLSSPPSLFPEDGSLHRHVQGIARKVSQHAAVRVVDKGPGPLWGFCRAWAWDALQEFLSQQGHTWEADTARVILQSPPTGALRHRCPVNNKARLALLYIIGKAKSRAQVEIHLLPPRPLLSHVLASG